MTMDQSWWLDPPEEERLDNWLRFRHTDINTIADRPYRHRPINIKWIRPIVPGLVTYDVVGVQPLLGHTGLVFSLRHTYNDLFKSDTA